MPCPCSNTKPRRPLQKSSFDSASSRPLRKTVTSSIPSSNDPPLNDPLVDEPPENPAAVPAEQNLNDRPERSKDLNSLPKRPVKRPLVLTGIRAKDETIRQLRLKGRVA